MEEQTLAERQLVIFNLANETYGVDISKVQEIIRLQDITKVPKTAQFIEGVINLRGNVIPVIDLRKRFSFSERENTNATRIVVVESGPYTIGMIVDSVSEVIRITEDSVEPPSNIMLDIDSDYILGVCKLNDRLIVLLDLSKVLTVSEKQLLDEAV
jgi:purine-binding chemotaxis protein CheW